MLVVAPTTASVLARSMGTMAQCGVSTSTVRAARLCRTAEPFFFSGANSPAYFSLADPLYLFFSLATLTDDSTHLLTGSADNMCKLWSVKTGECLHTWKHTAPVRDVRFALGDKSFLTCLDNIMGNVPTIFVWPLELSNLADHPDCPSATMLGHTAKVTRALFGPVNRSIFSGSDDATLRVWDPITGDQKGIVEGVHTKRISDVQLSWDMTFLVTSCSDMWVRLFETSSLQLLKAFNTERNINSAAISPLPSCPYLIAAGGQDAMSVTTTAAKQVRLFSPRDSHVCAPFLTVSFCLLAYTRRVTSTRPSTTTSSTTSSAPSRGTSARSTRSRTRRTAARTHPAARRAMSAYITCQRSISRRLRERCRRRTRRWGRAEAE